MNRDEIRDKIPGITDEQLQWLMDANGADINAEKRKTSAAQTQAETLAAQLQTAQDGLKAFEGVDVAALQGEITNLRGKLDEQAAAFAFDSTLDAAIREARGRNVKAIRGMLDLDALRASTDRSADIASALEALAQDNAWAFEPRQDSGTGATGTVSSGGEHGDGGAGEPDGVTAAFAALNPNIKL